MVLMHIKIIKQYKIVEKDIYNFNETGFTIDMIATTKIITRSENAGCLVLMQSGNYE